MFPVYGGVVYLRRSLSTAFGSWWQIFQQIFVSSQARQPSKIIKVLSAIKQLIKGLQPFWSLSQVLSVMFSQLDCFDNLLQHLGILSIFGILINCTTVTSYTLPISVCPFAQGDHLHLIPILLTVVYSEHTTIRLDHIEDLISRIISLCVCAVYTD